MGAHSPTARPVVMMSILPGADERTAPVPERLTSFAGSEWPAGEAFPQSPSPDRQKQHLDS